MSTAEGVLDAPIEGLGAERRPTLLRLVAVELRKMADTRAGFWLLLGTFGLMITVVIVNIALGPRQDQQFQDMMWIALWPATVLLPVVGILLVSSEWSQRTSLITFTLVPRRSRILLAKLGAGAVLSIVALVLALAVGAVGTIVAAPGVDGTWSLSPAMLGQATLYALITMTMGLAFGAAFLSSAPAIVLYFVLPLGWSLVGSIPAVEGVARWLDGGRSLEPISEHVLGATEWARVGTTLAVWLLLPMVVGAWRVARDEVS